MNIEEKESLDAALSRIVLVRGKIVEALASTRNDAVTWQVQDALVIMGRAKSDLYKVLDSISKRSEEAFRDGKTLEEFNIGG
jgi:hypothetical protein